MVKFKVGDIVTVVDYAKMHRWSRFKETIGKTCKITYVGDRDEYILDHNEFLINFAQECLVLAKTNWKERMEDD